MSIYCDNESDHRRDARRDFDRGRPDREQYDRHTFDGCKQAYTEEFDRLKREEERREEIRQEEREQERRAQASAERRRHEAQMEEERQIQEEEYWRQKEAEEAQNHQDTNQTPL
jgi:hypothetical protein